MNNDTRGYTYTYELKQQLSNTELRNLSDQAWAIHVVQHDACAGWIILPDRRHLLTAGKWHIHLLFSSLSDNFINRVRIHSPSPPWHKKPWLGNGHPSHKGVSVHTGFSAKPGGPVWERYSGTVLIDLELIWSFTLYLHIPRRPFLDAGNWLWKQKSRSPYYGRTTDNQELEASALFENEKSRDSYGFTPRKFRQGSKW